VQTTYILMNNDKHFAINLFKSWDNFFSILLQINWQLLRECCRSVLHGKNASLSSVCVRVGCHVCIIVLRLFG
jgi:hypothetical protein